ncbi:MAG: hypothetical protein BWZ02_01569 [Lentisphaerae bacterium ADurb.BinA184]|nr:MAG: hypothetical protein BWZ02_01569 [Lentisphaerae bacterium ADurb.BinA184]
MPTQPQSLSKRIGVVAILIADRQAAVARVNELLSEFGGLIVGRLGVPYRERNVSVIALLVDGTTDEIGAMTGRLGAVRGVKTKSLLLSPP